MIDIYNKIFDEVLLSIKPDKKTADNLVAVINKVVSWFNTAIRAEKIVAECVAGGSFAKGTFLDPLHDVDLFVRFSKDYKNSELSDILEHLIKLVSKKLKFKFKRVHGSRDYFQFEYRKLHFEIVPVIKIFSPSEAKNVTDCSPLHASFIKRHIQKHSRLADEIRLAKQFCKSAGVYGAESYIRGFSAHSIDLLIIFYGSFINFISATKYWGDKVIIDVSKKLKDPLKHIAKSKQHSPMILVDPIDVSRNATASLSKEKFEKLKQRAKEFLENPSIDFFRIQPLSPKQIKSNYKNEWVLFLGVEPVKEKSDDVKGTKIMKVRDFIKTELHKHDFDILETDFNFQYIYFVVKKQELSPFIVHRGPPKSKRKDAKEFKEKYKGKVYEKNNRLYVKIRRKYREPSKLILKLIKDKYVKSRVKSIKLLQRLR